MATAVTSLTALAIHQVQPQHQLTLKWLTLTTSTSSQPLGIPRAAIFTASQHSHPEHLCSSRCTLGTVKALMPLIAPVKSRKQYKKGREKYSGAESIQAGTLHRNSVGREAQLLITISPTQQTAQKQVLALLCHGSDLPPCQRVTQKMGGVEVLPPPGGASAAAPLYWVLFHSVRMAIRGKLCSWMALGDNSSLQAMLADLLYRTWFLTGSWSGHRAGLVTGHWGKFIWYLLEQDCVSTWSSPLAIVITTWKC